MKYYVKRICKDCKNQDLFEFTKVEVAFSLYDSKKIWNSACTKCNSTECSSVGYSPPKIDKELLDIWGANPNYYFMDQDEDIIIADIDYLNLFLDAIDKSSYPKDKIEILIAACCIILYDNTWFLKEFAHKDIPIEDLEDENKDAQKIADKVRKELIKRKDKVKESEKSIMDYIQQIVFPQIELNLEDLEED